MFPNSLPSTSSPSLPRRRRLGPLLVGVLALLTAALVSSPPPGSAAFPGADGRIAFTRANQIYTINADGTGLTKLTTGAKNFRPRFSPDGTQIAFIHETATGTRDIWLMTSAGQDRQRVTHLGNVSTAPAWSPDGAFLAFASPHGPFGDQDMQRVHTTAPFGTPTLIRGHAVDFETTNHAIGGLFGGGSIAWSPNGQHIIFNSSSFPDSPDDFLIDLNLSTHGMTEWDLIGGACCGEGRFGDIAWAPAGKRVANFVSNPLQIGPPIPPRIETFQYPTHAPSLLTSKRHDRQIAFSPSGDFVVFMNDASGSAQLFVTNADGSGRHFLTNGYHPDWQPLP